MPTPSLRSFTWGGGRGRPASPTFTATTSISVMDLGEGEPVHVLSRADLRNSVASYEALLSTGKAYQDALVVLASATTAFAAALDDSARLRGAQDNASELLAAGGLQYMIGNSCRVLANVVDTSFVAPLKAAHSDYVTSLSSRHASYEHQLKDHTAAIRATEAENLKAGRKKGGRDLNMFRQALERLQEQVRQVDLVKRSYYIDVAEVERENWEGVTTHVSNLLRSTVDLADRLTTKASSDPVLEGMMESHPDPWDQYRLEGDQEEEVRTVLPPLGLDLGASKRGSIARDASTSDFSVNGGLSSEEEHDFASPARARDDTTPQGTLRKPPPPPLQTLAPHNRDASASSSKLSGSSLKSPSARTGHSGHSRSSSSTTSTTTPAVLNPNVTPTVSRNGKQRAHPHANVAPTSASSLRKPLSSVFEGGSSAGATASPTPKSSASNGSRSRKGSVSSLSSASEPRRSYLSPVRGPSLTLNTASPRRGTDGEEEDPMRGDWSAHGPDYGGSLSPPIGGVEDDFSQQMGTGAQLTSGNLNLKEAVLERIPDKAKKLWQRSSAGSSRASSVKGSPVLDSQPLHQSPTTRRKGGSDDGSEDIAGWN